MSADELIQSGSHVSLHFSLALAGGEMIDSNFDGRPASFRMGDGSMLPGFEETLIGLAPGVEQEKLVPAEKAFGAVNPKNLQSFPVEKFQHLLEDDLIPTEPGSVVSFKDPAGFDLPGVVRSIDEQFIKVDFNHPLAGKDIVFRVRILSVLPPTVDTVEIKL